MRHCAGERATVAVKALEASVVEAMARLGRALRDDPRNRASVSLAAEHIRCGHGERLFQQLRGPRHEDGSDDDAELISMMTALEAMMDTDASVAGYFMARLFPIVGRRYLHAVADAIDLWLDASTSVPLADALTALAAEGVRPRLRKRYEGWAAKIRRTSATG